VITLRARLEGGILGLLVGDALGVPYEFHPPGALPPIDAIDFDPPAGFDRAHASVPPGTYSDDGAQALCLLASLLQHGHLDTDDLGRRLCNWYEHGYLAVDYIVFDVGIQTGTAIRAMQAGVRAAEAGPRDERANGNGSLMRVLPLALLHRGTDAELVADAHTQSLPTHGHVRSQVCCALYVLWARESLAGRDDAWLRAVATLRGIYRAMPDAHEQLEFHVRPDEEATVQGSGYVVDSLRSARWAVGQGTYERAMRAAVSLGSDTDTTAAIAGGIAGVRDGVDAIPARWRERLRGRETYAPLIERLVAASG
jgi:ADP-ribosyl-[dinitrogen reductase] hydrolase